MIIKRLALDVELTNRCNALCTFCPREKTPKQGFMSDAVFYQAVERAREEGLDVMLTGQGEGMIHPKFDQFVDWLGEQQQPFALTSNASLLKPERSARLLAAGIKRITFSVSDLGDDYKKVYNLSVENTLANIDEFLRQRALMPESSRPQVWISIVEHGANASNIDQMREFWWGKGVDDIYQFKLTNRGGACESDHLFLNTRRQRTEAEKLMLENGVSSLCNLAFTAPFIGWNGNYYICCSDYEKLTPLATVFDYSLSELDAIKMQSIYDGNAACLKCNYDPLNTIQEALLQAEAGLKPPRTIKNKLSIIKKSQLEYPELYSVTDWRSALDANIIIKG